MSELELALTRLGRELDYPETPDLTGAVRRRLVEGRRPRSWRRPLVIALAAVLVVVAAVMAVPQARSEVLDWFGIGSVTIHYVDELPKLEGREEFELGARVPLAEARDRAQFAILMSTLEGLEHPKVYYRGDIGMVSLLYGTEEEPRLLISELVSPGAIDKLLSSQTDVEPVREDEWSGAWLSGGQHVLFLPVQDQLLRLVGNVLVVHNSSTTVRIEADVSKDEALRILRSLE
ncbi:MAG TPA: hypothetical protein VKB13_04295 [Gaiellaceae bacterium]|nr:hypothetical protein [Gaiellaceae bacterium]